MRIATRLLTAMTLSACSCGGQPGNDSGAQGADTVGVVVNQLTDDLATWSVLVDSPLVKIGGNDDPDYDLENMPYGARLSDGRLIVADGYSQWPVRVYSPSGRLLKKFRKGPGPEEFASRYIQPLVTAGDTVVFWQSSNAPLRLMSPTYQMQTPAVHFLPSDNARLQLFERLGDGTWIAVRQLIDSIAADDPADREARWIAWSADTTRVRSLHKFPLLPSSRGYFDQLIIPWATYFFRGTLGYFAYNKSPEIEVRDTSGRVLRRMRVDIPAQPVTRQDVQDVIDHDVTFGGQSRSDAEAAMKKRLIAKRFPYFEWPLHVDSDGNIWVPLFRKRYWSDDTRFLIFSPEGRLIAQSVIPLGIVLLNVGSDRLVFRNQDDSTGHWYLQVAPIRKPSP